MGATLSTPAARRAKSAPARMPRAGTRCQEAELFRRAGAGDPAARERLTLRFLPLARAVAARYRRGDEPLDDLFQVASMALVKALARYEPERGVAFPSYAVPTIVGELKRYLRDTRWAAYVPQRLRERALAVDRATERLRHSLGHAPTVGELAGELGIEPAEVADALRAATAYDAVSLDAPYAGAGEDGPTIGDALGSVEERYDLVEYEATIAAALQALPPRQRAILRFRFDDDLTQAEIAERMGVSQMHVSRLLRQSLGRLREVARVRHADRAPLRAG